MKKVLIIIFAIILAGSIGWYFYAKNTRSQGGVPSLSDFGSFFPIGVNSDPNIPGTISDPNSSNTDTTITPTPSPYKQLSPHPVANYSAYATTSTIVVPADPAIPKSKPTTQIITHEMVRYVARSSGYVYEIEDEAIPLQVSNVYIPNIYEALFGDKNSSALIRFLHENGQTIATYAVPVPPPNPDGSRTQKEGLYLPDNITSIAVSPDSTQIARVTGDTTGALISITGLFNTKKVDILRTPFKEWIISWPNTKNLYLQTKASAEVPGYLYRLDTTEKKLRRVLGNINGLTANVSPSGNYVLYSQNSGLGFVTKLLNTKTGEAKAFNLAILPEKCVWLKAEDLICAGNTSVPEGKYPDAWYMGTVSFSDQLYRIYTGSALYDRLDDTTPMSFDITNLQVNESKNTLYFTDKSTGVLWQFSY